MTDQKITEIANRLRVLSECSMSDGRTVTATLLIGDANFIENEFAKIDEKDKKIQELETTIKLLKSAIRGESSTTTAEMLEWISERIVQVYKESPDIDYVLSLKRRAKLLEEAGK